jgi:predicted house-cleaning noncanonical NTP pyrophosphatase (MazG superfamily)
VDRNGKLVRDRIPDIVEAAGGTVTTRHLEPAGRLPALLDKLQEESDELRAADTTVHRTEELADVLEVLLALATDFGVSWANVEAVAAAKRAERGGFQQGIWMELA